MEMKTIYIINLKKFAAMMVLCVIFNICSDLSIANCNYITFYILCFLSVWNCTM